MAGQPRRVLLVEDSTADVELALAAFERAAPTIAVEVVGDGEEAMSYLSERATALALLPELILLDLNLPRMNGREVLAAIRDDTRLTHLPVVVLSTSSNPREVRDLYRLHVSAYVVKPVSLAAFADIVASITAFWFTSARLPQD